MPNKYKRIILKISGEILGSRSEGEPIHAKSLENIWIEKDLFSNAMKDSVEKAKNLVIAAESGDKNNIAKSLGALGKTCGSCHNKFRKKKN